MNNSVRSRISSAVFRFRMLRSFQNPAYRFYLPGSLSQFATLSMQIVAGPLLMYRLTGSPALLGTMALVSAFPMIFVSLFGGAIADRVPKKRVVIACLLGSSAVALGIALAISSGYLSRDNPVSPLILILAMFCTGSLMGMMMPAPRNFFPCSLKRWYTKGTKA